VKKILVAVSALVAVAGIAGPASAKPLPVTVTTNNGGVQVGVSVNGQPASGVSADNDGICAGISLQVEHCIPVTVG
jgi:alpha-D-ribose 1-methylphosphonate 5-phosphate C-P lyase